MEELAGTAWTLTHFETDAGSVPALAEAPGTLEFAVGGRVGGTGGCNRYFAGYTLSGNGLTVGQMGSTRMMCSPERMAEEDRFLQALQEARSYQRQGDALTIEYAGGTLHFTRTETKPDGGQPAAE